MIVFFTRNVDKLEVIFLKVAFYVDFSRGEAIFVVGRG